MWFLFQDILTFRGNIVEPQSDYPLLQSTINVFSLFKLQVKFDGDELSQSWIHFSCCKKVVHCQIYEVKQSNFTRKKILPVFIKAIVLHHVGLSWMIATNDQHYFAMDEHYEEWCTGGLWFS